MKFILLLLPALLFAESPKPNPVFTFGQQKEACKLVDGKLILSHPWPLGSWEDCAYSVLDVAAHLDKEVGQCKQALQAPKK